MNKIYSLLIAFMLFSCVKNNKYYKEINEEQYSKFLASDTLISNPNILITQFEDSIFKNSYHLLLRKNEDNKSKYYKLDSSCEIENDSTLFYYAPPFMSDSENGSFQKNGIWIYVTFFDEENKKGNSICNTSESGANFSIDSLPVPLKLVSMPKSEGIYFYQKDSLVMVSKEQSEDQFYSQKKNGFYFIPNRGRLFTRINIKSIQ
jgi:hypothetical protein